MLERLEKMLNAGMVERFHTGLTITRQTIGQHTFNMLVIADFVYRGETPPELMKAILYHDMHEVETGDIPWPMKQRPAIREHIAAIENKVNDRYAWTVELPAPQAAVLKAIDMLEFMMYLKLERNLGNRNNTENYHKAKAVVSGILYGINTAPEILDRLSIVFDLVTNHVD
jgi:5'-deoxynucleotidase YfbR-like HD superfamily hydrolase